MPVLAGEDLSSNYSASVLADPLRGNDSLAVDSLMYT